MIGAHKAAILGAAGGGVEPVLYAPLDEASGWENDLTSTALTTEGNAWGSSTSSPPTGISRYAVTNASGNSNFVSDVTIDGDEDWTLECFYRHALDSPGNGLTLQGSGQKIGLYSDNADWFIAVNGQTGFTPGLTVSQWYHMVLMNSGGTYYGFFDGTLLGSRAFAGPALGSASIPELGYRPSSDAGGDSVGWSSWRVTPAAIYSTSGFTPPTLPLY